MVFVAVISSGFEQGIRRDDGWNRGIGGNWVWCSLGKMIREYKDKLEKWMVLTKKKTTNFISYMMLTKKLGLTKRERTLRISPWEGYCFYGFCFSRDTL